MKAFVGIPLKCGPELFCVLGLANRPQGYDMALLNSLWPVVSAGMRVIKDCPQLKEHDTALLKQTNELLNLEVVRLKRKQEELQKERDKFYEIVANLGTCFYVVDQTCKISHINKAALTLLGWCEETVIGQSAHTLFHHTQADRSPYPPSDCFLREVLLQGKVVKSEEELFWCQDGRCISVAMTAAPILRDGEVSGVVVSFRDIAKRKRVEEELSVARAKAESVAKARSDFLYTMSHEIRTPMTGVLGMADLLLKTPMSELQQHYVQTIHRAGRTLLRIINDILDLSKIQAGQLSLERLRFDLDEVIQGILDMFATRIRDKGLKFHCTIPEGEIHHLMGDPYRLSQVLFNLVGNALKFTEEGSIGLSVEVLEEGETDALLRFRVTDTGIGMSSEFQSDLFQVFSQEAPSISRKFGGTGLGLAITQRLVVKMQGEMGVESVPGHGSSFWFSARFGKQLESDRQNVVEWRSDQRLSASESLCFNGHVLLVEDNLVNQEVAVATLSQFGCQVTVANNGQRAMALLRENNPPFDIILMDCEMPILDGFETTRLLREWELNTGGARIPIIALTAHVLEQSRRQCQEAGMDDYLRKPFSSADLGVILKRWLSPPGADITAGDQTFSLSGPSQETASDLPFAITIAEEGKCDEEREDDFDTLSIPLLDTAALEQILDLAQRGKHELLTIMVEHFVSRTPELLAELKQSLERGDVEGVRVTAHSLKSSSLIMGAKHLAAMGRAMEMHHADLERVRRHVHRMDSMFADVCQALQEFERSQRAGGDDV
ncbi:MAG: response regulator [Magnetococcales bacterium]|nr:response regulator [Magnetococcales bacterium]